MTQISDVAKGFITVLKVGRRCIGLRKSQLSVKFFFEIIADTQIGDVIKLCGSVVIMCVMRSFTSFPI